MSWVAWSQANSVQTLCDDSDAASQAPPASLGEEAVPSHDITPEQLVDYARSIGIDERRVDLFWIAEHGLTAPLPRNWKSCTTDDADRRPAHQRKYYFNTKSGESMWEHPLDKYFRELAKCFSGVSSDKKSKDAASQTAAHTAHRGVQAEQETAAAATLATVERRSRGADPMPGASTTMTACLNEQVTMTTPTIEPLPVATETVSVGPSYPTIVPHSARSFRPARSSLHDFKLPSGRDGGGGGKSSPAPPPPPPEPDAITKQMISEFQQCLSQHKKEVLDVVARQSQARPVSPPPEPEVGAAGAPPQPPSFPEVDEAAAGTAWGTYQWLLSYALMGLVHVALCLCVMHLLPLVLTEEPAEQPEGVFAWGT